MIPTFGADFAGIASDVRIEQCTLKEGPAVARGTVANSDDSARDLLVAIVWLGPGSGDSLLLRYETFAAVPAGATRNWELRGELHSEAERCVLQAKANVVGTIKG